MAREKMITRTIEDTTIEVMTLDITSASVQTYKYHLSGQFTADEALKKLKKAYETDALKLVHIESMNTVEVLYGMTEEDFIAHAVVLPPRNINK